jgi:pyruvate kinase
MRPELELRPPAPGRLQPHKTRIAATIEPAWESPAVLERMIRAGIHFAWLNLSHGEFEAHARTRSLPRVDGDLRGPKA